MIRKDPNAWTSRDIFANPGQCFNFLKKRKQEAVRCIGRGDLPSGVAELIRAQDGLAVLRANGFRDLDALTAIFAMAKGQLLAFGDLSETDSGYLEDGCRAAAINDFERARNHTEDIEMKQNAQFILSALKADIPLDEIRRRHAASFPDTVVDILDEVDRVLPDAASVQRMARRAAGAPVPAGGGSSFVGDGSFDGERSFDGAAYPAAADTPARSAGLFSRLVYMPGWDFGEWVQANGWSAEDLDVMYSQAIRRRNVCGVLTFTPVGLLFAPFWIWAIYLSRAIREQTFDVRPGALSSAVYCIWGLLTLFLYPTLVQREIKQRQWCMSPGGPGAALPVKVCLWVLIPVLLVCLAFKLPDILGAARDFITGEPGDTSVQTGGSAAAPALAGDWYSLDVVQRGSPSEETGVTEYHEVLSYTYYSFGADGTYRCDTLECTNSGPLPGETFSAFGQDWYVTGREQTEGSYELEGERLALSQRTERYVGTWYVFWELDGGALLLDEDEDGKTPRAFRQADPGLGPAELAAVLSAGARPLYGSWSNAVREDTTIVEETYVFHDNGFFEHVIYPYLNTAYDPLEGESGWYVAPMGHPGEYGTYTFDGKDLVLHVFEDEYYGFEEEILTFPVEVKADGQEIGLDGVRFLNGYWDIEALCGRLGVDASVDR